MRPSFETRPAAAPQDEGFYRRQFTAAPHNNFSIMNIQSSLRHDCWTILRVRWKWCTAPQTGQGGYSMHASVRAGFAAALVAFVTSTAFAADKPFQRFDLAD